jgi:AcrR family transcriptional regulator
MTCHHEVMPRRPTGAPNGRPPRTSKSEILAAARLLIDQDGWERLTVRRLAAEVGTSPATVYYHVRDKGDLLVQLFSDYADRIPRAELPDDPRQRILAAATLIHDALAAWPWAVEILTADDLLGDSALWLVEAILAGAADAGCTPSAAVRLYRHIWTYTVGEILIRASRNRRQAELDGQPTYRDQAFASLDPATYPQITSLAARWPALTSQDTYTDGVWAIINGSLNPARPS